MLPSHCSQSRTKFSHAILVILTSALLFSGCGVVGSAPTTAPPPEPNPVPTISSISPSTMIAGATPPTLTINGEGFIQSSLVQWNQSNRITTFVSSTELQVALTAADVAQAGTMQIAVLNPAPGGGASAATTFTINNPAPQISGISPSTVSTIDGGSTVTVTGTGFVSNSTVTWNTVARATTFVSVTRLQFKLLPSDVANVGSSQISVINPTPGGGTSAPSQMSVVYPVPVVTSLAPGTVAPGGQAFTLTILGSGFSPISVVMYNGTARATTYVDSGTLTIAVTSTDIANPTTAQITVSNGAPGGGISAPPAILTISQFVVPTITSINPNSINIGSPDSLEIINGTGFSSSSTVQVNGGSPLSNSGGNNTQLLFTLPAANFTSIGSLSITVSNPGTSPSNAVIVTVAPNPVPAISGISPNSAAVGSTGFTLTASGSNFVPTSVLQWNGSARATTFVSNYQITATISAPDIQTLGNSSVTVSNPSPGGGTSTASTFTTYLNLAANDLVFSQSMQLLYASVPSTAGPGLGNSIVSIDPYTGTLGAPIFVGSEPNKLALSSDGNTIWVSLNGAASVREVNLITQTPGTQIGLGGGPGIYDPPSTAQALAVMPGHPDTVAVAAPPNFGYSSDVTIYDSGVARTNAQSSNLSCCSGIVGMVFDPTGTKLYEAGSGYGIATVDSTGITGSTALNTSVQTNALRVDSGRAYLTSGVILDANLGTQLGVFSVSQGQNAYGPVAPDSSIGEGFVVTNPNFGAAYQINTYDLLTFILKGSIPVSVTNGSTGQVTALTRWGQDGLAFTTGSQVYILRSPLVRDLSSSLADLSISANVPAFGTTGTNLNYSLTVKNAGPVTASRATLIDDLPSGSTLQSVSASQGSCSFGAELVCDLGVLNAGSSGTVQFTVTPLTPGTLTNTATVYAPEGDPNPANNTVVSTTAITGSVYNPNPAMTSISPDLVQAGSPSFTLTINGSGFVAGSTVQLNSTALATTFVSDSQLSATVPAGDVASMGWSWINVTNAAPGGGSTSSLPLTTYGVVSLDVNRFSFDPYTRQLYATVPSTATQVAGNSLVAIDPVSGSLGAPINIGSEPNRLSESSDGHYIYIGLDGSLSLTRVDLTSMTQGPVYPLTIPSMFQGNPPIQFAARDLAVVPGNDNLLAIDAGSFNGNGLLDISGTTGTMRSHLTGPYTGSNLVFANSTTLYTYDSDTSGAEFNRWTVTSTGLTLNNNTGYTLNGIGGFSGSFKLANGIVYGVGGGVADPTTTPPTQLGQFSVNSAQGMAQSIAGSGVAPDPALGRVFIQGETLAGSANPVLLTYDSNRYVLLGMEQITGAAQGEDLLRWGRDGLAWHSSLAGAFGNSTPGSGQIFLVRGPAVLPEWGNNNPTPGLISVSPSIAAAGSGNLNITVTGSNFVPGAILLWNGAERTTTFVDSSHLTIAIPASDVSQSGSATLVVNNPSAPNSGSISFTIN